VGETGGPWGRGSPQGSQLKFAKFQIKISSVDFRAPDYHHTIPRAHTNNVSSGHFLARGQIRELGPPKESKSETPNLIAPRGDVKFWRYFAKKFFGPSSIFWHMRNFVRGVPTPKIWLQKVTNFQRCRKPVSSAPTKNFLIREFFGGPVQYRMAKRGCKNLSPNPR